MARTSAKGWVSFLCCAAGSSVGIGRSIILGLEFLIAGDVIRTVVVASTLENVGVLALIIVIGTFLSFALAMEVEGRLPWQNDTKKNG